MSDNLYIGNQEIRPDKKKAEGQFVQIDNEMFYEIKNYDNMLPFFISIASDSNHWMFISSTGALTAGRTNPDHSLFPYYTDDKINESSEITGSKTILQVLKNDRRYLWEPFSDRYKGIYSIERTILKNAIGNKILFCENNIDLGLSFSYIWMNADNFGWIKKSRLINESSEILKISIVDGLQNILPSGIDRLTQNTFSTLVDRYKKTELINNSNVALFRMESILVDRAEPSESLRANVVWSEGMENAFFLLSSTQLNNFRTGVEILPETESKGVRGSYFACSNIKLQAKSEKSWYFIAELDQDIAQVNNLLDFIQQTKEITSVIDQNIEKGNKNLLKIVAQADGIQQTADKNDMARHFSNVLFNTMRGGIYSEAYTICTTDLITHIKHFNENIWTKNQGFLSSLPETLEYVQLEELIRQQNNANLYRLFLEYLPLTFSRRHGDPSRPWNLFNIKVNDGEGNKLISYQGNWRDIFQNWEALSLSFPEYINGIIAKFLNATTADGYNPYKITDGGIDWEVIEPENPWSNIGYWGDHQIIYLLKLIEISYNHYPEKLFSLLDKELFAYANVPYRIKNYNDIVSDPKNSISFDNSLHHSIEKLQQTYGADARLILNKSGEVKLVSFTEKLLATLLAKLSNFIPEAGIWMNTLRPEWNDANNALVGQGASMVTVYYMRRFVAFIEALYQQSSTTNYSVSSEMSHFFKDIFTALESGTMLLEDGFDNTQRRAITDKLGIAGTNYRNCIYKGFKGTKKNLLKKELTEFFALVLKYIDQSIAKNKRPDNMYHAYNLVRFTDNSISIRNLYEMLEGQVAVLSSGKLTPVEAVDVLDALRKSSLYRTDQQSYILYPNKKLPLFLEKNNIANEDVVRIKLLQQLVEAGDKSIIIRDNNGKFHFNANFKNVLFLRDALNKLKASGTFDITLTDKKNIEDIYEKTFDHQSFTGRSGTFYKYEGLGCIYWHMVSKLLLAIGENIKVAETHSSEAMILNRLKQHYFEVKKGIGAHKSPAEYGSFPFDPYSHTPTMAGVQQPGMTGQVKEDIISRFFELGIRVENGCLVIKPTMLKQEEFIQPTAGHPFPHLSFSYCSILFEYRKDGKAGIEIMYKNNIVEHSDTYSLNTLQSYAVFERNKNIRNVVVHF